MKIVVLDGYTENPGDLSWDALEKLGELTVYDRTSFNNEQEIIERIGDAEVVYTNKTPITKNVLDACKNIKMISVLATGYNVVDYVHAGSKGIPVLNAPAYSTASAAQMTIAMLLEICQHVGDHSNAVHSGRWENNQDWCFWDHPLIELAGKTMGIIGFGKIGQGVGKIARALGMRVIAYSRTEKPEAREIGEYVTLDELYAQADVISLHCPLFPENEGMINRESIAKMKDGVILLNNARGPLIVEQDLADALNSGKVYAAGLDVVSAEPIRGDNPLLKANNAFITPHISWASKESRMRLMEISVRNLESFLAGNAQNVVNGEYFPNK